MSTSDAWIELLSVVVTSATKDVQQKQPRALEHTAGGLSCEHIARSSCSPIDGCGEEEEADRERERERESERERDGCSTSGAGKQHRQCKEAPLPQATFAVSAPCHDGELRKILRVFLVLCLHNGLAARIGLKENVSGKA